MSTASRRSSPTRTPWPLQFRRSLARHAVNEMIDEIRVSARDTAALAAIPDDLTAQVRQLLDDDATMSWDDAVTQIAGVA